MQEDVQCIILGSGDSEYEQFFEWMAYEYPEKVKVYIDLMRNLHIKCMQEAIYFNAVTV